MVEPLESRRLLHAYFIAGGTLFVEGHDYADVFRFSLVDQAVRITEDIAPGQFQSFALGTFDRIQLDLGAGNDRVFVDGSITVPMIINGGAGNDTIMGGSGSDQLNGGPGNDVLIAGPGADAFNGGSGIDRVDYSAYTVDIQVSLDGIANDGAAGESDNVGVDVENVYGGSGNDIIIGSDAPNLLLGNAGNDALSGGGGNDTLGGGKGNDTLAGGAGNDWLIGGLGADVISGGEGVDSVDYREKTVGITIALDGVANDGTPGEGDNVGADIEHLYGGAGNDLIIGNGARNYIDGGPGNDTLAGANGHDTLVGGPGNDSLSGGNGNDVLIGGTGADLFNGGPGRDTADYSSRTANLSLTIDSTANDGEPGELDNILGDIENILGGAGDDLIVGNAKDNYLAGNAGNDTILGGSGNDTLIGGRGRDKLYGDSGSDFFDARDGFRDTLVGGSGVDTALFDDEDYLESIP